MRREFPQRAQAALAVLALSASSAALAAGGHHAAEDAAIAEPGQCDLETWRSAGRSGFALSHLGASCRVGPLELGAAAEGHRQDGAAHSAWSLQAKWAQPLSPTLAVGVAVTGNWQQGTPRYAGTSVLLPLTWQAHEALTLHAHLGRDLLRGEPGQPRWGVAAEWAATAQQTLLLERFRENGERHLRLGLRHAVTPRLSLDLSRTRIQGDGGYWSAGLNWNFDR